VGKCKSFAHHSRELTTPAPNHPVFSSQMLPLIKNVKVLKAAELTTNI